jgi:hypothetical protein
MPMSLDETRSYVRGRLDYADASPGLRERFDDELVARLHREAGGNPRRLHGLATWILHRDGLATDAGPPSPEEGSWLDPDAAAAWPMEGPAALEIDEIEAALREPDPPPERDLSAVGSVDNPTPGG